MFEEQSKLMIHFGFHKNDYSAHPAFPNNVSIKSFFIGLSLLMLF